MVAPRLLGRDYFSILWKLQDLAPFVENNPSQEFIACEYWILIFLEAVQNIE